MKTFSVKGNGWHTLVEVDDALFEKYSDMACEATTRAIEMLFNNEIELESDEAGIGLVLVAVEEGRENDPNYEYVILAEHALRNAGFHNLADNLKEIVEKEAKRFKN